MKFRIFTAFVVLPVLLLLTLTSCDKRQEKISRPNVLLIVVDTLAVKHLGTYNAAQKVSPHIDSLAQNAAVFERAYSSAPWTKPSIVSLFTSLYPSQHGVRSIHDSFSHSLTALPDILKDNSYETKGLVSHTLIAPGKGFGQGFDAYDIVPFTGNVHDSVTSQTVSSMAVDWLKGRSADAKRSENPFLLYLHYFDVHFNYQHHAQYDKSSWYKGKLTPGVGFRELREIMPNFTAEDYKYLSDLYDEEIAYTDEYLAQVFQALDDLKLRENTIVILTADHGEAFGERGAVGHTESLHDELVHIPLIFSWPGKIPAKRIPESVGNIDVLPSLLDLLQIKVKEADWQGVSFAQALLGRGLMATGRSLFAEVDFRSQNIYSYFDGVFQDTWKFIRNKKTKAEELYNVSTDAGEKNNLLNSETEKASELRAELDRFRNVIAQKNKKIPAEGKKKVKQTKEEVEQLKSLGYL